MKGKDKYSIIKEAIDNYQAASDISSLNPKYHHAKGIAYEALAADIEKTQGRLKKFDEEELSVDMRCSDSLVSYLNEKFLEYSNQAIKHY